MSDHDSGSFRHFNPDVLTVWVSCCVAGLNTCLINSRANQSWGLLLKCKVSTGQRRSEEEADSDRDPAVGCLVAENTTNENQLEVYRIRCGISCLGPTMRKTKENLITKSILTNELTSRALDVSPDWHSFSTSNGTITIGLVICPSVGPIFLNEAQTNTCSQDFGNFSMFNSLIITQFYTCIKLNKSDDILYPNGQRSASLWRQNVVQNHFSGRYSKS